MYLYLLLNLASISIPFAYSFEKRMHFIKWWKEVFLSITITALLFIIWDIIFTKNGVWGFNEAYLVGVTIVNLPIEEWLFFICIPYACVFTHYAFQHFIPNLKLSVKLVNGMTIGLLVVLAVVVVLNIEKQYTFYNFLLLILILVYSLITQERQLQTFYITFLIILIPFFIVNGILTGSFIIDQVVWYNNAENLGIRLGTIPVEDIGYAFSMIFLSIILIEKFKKAFKNETI
ncbi:MAG: lycopene cyclase domain-containing protein [Flavobacteriaceae bacterium]|nr:lycopene cyclase domain-containing protein [Flavobacteriaceae bacterium]